MMTLTEYLEEKGQSSKDFATEIGVSSVTIRRYELGKRIPLRDELTKIYEATNGHVTANDFHDQTPVPSGAVHVSA